MTTANVTRLFEDARSLRGLARSLVAHAGADDLVQDALIVATTSPPDGGASRPWLGGVIRNLARMRHREAARRRDREQAADLDRVVDAPDRELHRMQVQRALCDAVVELPELYRRVIVMHHLDGLSLAAIARREGVAEGTIRWRHKEALDRLRAALDDRSGGDRRAWLAALAPLGRAPAWAAMTFVKLIALAVLALATVALVVAVRSSSPPSTTANAGPAPGAGSARATSAPAAPHLGSAAPANEHDVGVFGRVPAAPPERYLLTVASSTLAAVDLAGGTSGLYQPDFGPKPAPGSRVITGRVVDPSGHPLAGAVVVVSARLSIQWGQLSGEAGATAAADGRFRIEPAPDDKDAAIVALHPSGWSPVTAVTGKDVRLVIAPGGAIAGKVSYGSTPVPASLSISPVGFDHVRFMFETGADGRYRFPLLAAGRYEVSAWPTRGIGGGGGNPERAELTVAANATTTHDFALAEGVLLVVHPTPPAGKVPSIVDVFLFAGHHAIGDRAAMSQLIAGLPRDAHDELLHGGSNATDPIQFHDRAPGPYTACAELRFDGTDVRAFGCQPFDLADAPDVRELEIATQ